MKKSPTITNSPKMTKGNSKSRMLEALKITKFQTHRKTEVIFPPGARIIAFVGETGAGKSCLMRGLYYLYLLGKYHVQYGKETCIVSNTFGDIIVSRETLVNLKGKKVDDHLTLLDNQEMGEEHGWVKFHKELPAAFRNSTGIGYLDIEDLKNKFSLNFIGQHDRCLPREYRPSEISKIFGSVSGRNRVDSAIKATNVAIGRVKSKIKITEDLIQENEEKLEKLKEQIPDVDPNVDDLIQEWKDIEEIDNLWGRHWQLGKHIQKLEERIELIDDALDDLDLDGIWSDISTLGRVYKLEKVLKIPCEASVSFADEAISGIDVLGDELGSCEALINLFREYRKCTEAEELEKGHLSRTEKSLNGTRQELRSFLKEHKLCPYSMEKLPKACAEKLAS